MTAGASAPDPLKAAGDALLDAVTDRLEEVSAVGSHRQHDTPPTPPDGAASPAAARGRPRVVDPLFLIRSVIMLGSGAWLLWHETTQVTDPRTSLLLFAGGLLVGPGADVADKLLRGVGGGEQR